MAKEDSVKSIFDDLKETMSELGSPYVEIKTSDDDFEYVISVRKKEKKS